MYEAPILVDLQEVAGQGGLATKNSCGLICITGGGTSNVIG